MSDLCTVPTRFYENLANKAIKICPIQFHGYIQSRNVRMLNLTYSVDTIIFLFQAILRGLGTRAETDSDFTIRIS